MKKNDVMEIWNNILKKIYIYTFTWNGFSFFLFCFVLWPFIASLNFACMDFVIISFPVLFCLLQISSDDCGARLRDRGRA